MDAHNKYAIYLGNVAQVRIIKINWSKVRKGISGKKVKAHRGHQKCSVSSLLSVASGVSKTLQAFFLKTISLSLSVYNLFVCFNVQCSFQEHVNTNPLKQVVKQDEQPRVRPPCSHTIRN